MVKNRKFVIAPLIDRVTTSG